jgi:hypothetical protein
LSQIGVWYYTVFTAAAYWNGELNILFVQIMTLADKDESKL